MTQSYIRFAQAEFEFETNAVKPVRGNMKCTYVVRRVADNARSIVEGDDTAIYVSGDIEPRMGLVLIPAEMIEYRVWYLKTGVGDPVYIDGPEGKTGLQFATYGSALEMKVWAREHGAGQDGAIRIGNYALGVEADGGYLPLGSTEAQTLRIGVKRRP